MNGKTVDDILSKRVELEKKILIFNVKPPKFLKFF